MRTLNKTNLKAARVNMMLAFILVLSLAGTVSASVAQIPPLEEKYIVETLGKLEERRGYNDKAWDKLLAYAIQYEDVRILNKILDVPVTQGISEINYRLDLFEILKAKPKFFLHRAYEHFGKNVDCLVFRLVPFSQQISFRELASAVTPLVKDKDELARTFFLRARDYRSRMKRDARLNVKNCPLHLLS